MESDTKSEITVTSLALSAYSKYPAAKIYFELPYMTIEDAVKNFNWGKLIIDRPGRNRIIYKLIEEENGVLNIDAQNLIDNIDQNEYLIRKYYRTFLNSKDQRGAKDLIYHNEDHSVITADEATLLAIIGLKEIAENSVYSKHFLADRSLYNNLLTFLNFAANFHEVAEWGKDNLKNPQEAKRFISEQIKKLGFSNREFNLMLGLTPFMNVINDEYIENLLKQNPEDGFLPENQNDIGFFDKLGDPKFQKVFLKMAGLCMRAADLKQAMDPAYLQNFFVLDKNENIIRKTNIGAAVLAHEFERIRPNALKPSKWQKENNELEADYARVFTDPFFINVMVKAVEPTMKYLEKVDLERYERDSKILDTFKASLN